MSTVFKYAILDLASAPELQPAVFSTLRSEAQPLLARNLAPDVLAVGPWVLNLHSAPMLAQQLDDLAADRPWGFYVHTSIDITSLRHAFRRFNLVRLAGMSQEVLFRYWDPRVMGVFLRVCTRDQRKRLFEFIDRIEAPDGSFDAQVKEQWR